MTLIPLVLALQVATQPREPVLSFPDRTLDDAASYQGYETRFYRDAAGNTVQLYKERSSGRLVHLLANADNESIGLTVRADGAPAALSWGDSTAQVRANKGFRTLSHSVLAHAPRVSLGWFLLGSMRVERDFQYWGRHKAAFASPPFELEELTRFFAAIDRLPATTRQRHLAQLGATSVAQLRARIRPVVTTSATARAWTARVRQRSLDGRDSLMLEIRVDPRHVNASVAGDSIVLSAKVPGAESREPDAQSAQVQFTVTVGSSAAALTPLARSEIFTPEFLRFLAANRASAPLLERQARGVELLSSREKLMAGLPAYATYFGRDMLVSALMMRPIWRDEMAEFSIASVLRKLSPTGQVSHEEAMGGQAVRESVAEYATLVERALGSGIARPAADSLLAHAVQVLRQQRRTRENYHMVDDEFQFPVLAASWLSDPDVPARRKRDFLLHVEGGERRVDRLLRELALVARMTEAYAAEQTATNLVSFPPRDSGWAAASWRDSGVGYAGGRFAMDVNAIWVPHALESIAVILRTLPSLGIPLHSVAKLPELSPGTPLGRYARDAATLERSIASWRGAVRHFVIRMGPDDVRARVSARVDVLPLPERQVWSDVLTRTGALNDSLTYLALALDANGAPIGVANTDVATRLFLAEPAGEDSAESRDAVLRDVCLFTRHYPAGLFIDGVGPVVANDAYASPAVWAAFERDRYHGPRVVWGREVNLFLLGVANQLRGLPPDTRYANALRTAMTTVQRAADASGFQSELWSYEVRDGRVVPVRYGTGSDVQLWSTTDLAVHFALSRLGLR